MPSSTGKLAQSIGGRQEEVGYREEIEQEEGWIRAGKGALHV